MIEKAVPQGGGFPLLLPGLLCKAAADAPARDWEMWLGVLPAWPGVRAAGGKSSSQKLWYGRNAKLSSTLAAGPFFVFIYVLFIVIGGVNLQIDHKDARDGQAWVKGAVFSADCKFVSEAIELKTSNLLGEH